jgi:hypothetical protein
MADFENWPAWSPGVDSVTLEGRPVAEESFDGPVARLFRKRLQRQLDETTRNGLQALKTAAERSSTE